jgi:D-alanyl-D-alanine carboxypeptidase/D-alanyl-D-alanine-endopeptidase (penicillin-binding protein 4)
VESAPVSALVRHMDVYSDNFYAEMLLKEVGAVQGSAGSAAAGIAVTRQLLAAAGVPLAGVRMVDGSGLSLVDRWTPAGLATLLRTMWLNPDLQPYVVPSLPLAGVTGTLEHRMRTGPARGHVRAKTGTTANSSALSGFVGDRYVFSIVENGRPVKTFYAEQSQNHFAQVLARAAS